MPELSTSDKKTYFTLSFSIERPDHMKRASAPSFRPLIAAIYYSYLSHIDYQAGLAPLILSLIMKRRVFAPMSITRHSWVNNRLAPGEPWLSIWRYIINSREAFSQKMQYQAPASYYRWPAMLLHEQLLYTLCFDNQLTTNVHGSHSH